VARPRSRSNSTRPLRGVGQPTQHPTIDVYLYDIREDLRRRERGLLNEYEGNRVRARHLRLCYFKLSHLVAAWTQRPEDEYVFWPALMGASLIWGLADVLTGSPAALGLSVPVSVALPPPEDRSFTDVWTALGGELKPSLNIVVTAPTDTGRAFPAGPMLEKPTVLIAGPAGLFSGETARRRAIGTDLRGNGRRRGRRRRHPLGHGATDSRPQVSAPTSTPTCRPGGSGTSGSTFTSLRPRRLG
jgi:hypothetical protein